uniref:Secreted protein n=1 Tax=Esox lucius TaxID=8010 RepID=A0AAY5L667_ESOLU
MHWCLGTHSICFLTLSRRIAVALQHEERRCQYLTREAKLMLAVQDEVTTMTESETKTSSFTTDHCLSLIAV